MAGALTRRPRSYLAGRLIPLSGPVGAALPLPRELDGERRRQVDLGRRGRGDWRLPDWTGALRLTAGPRGRVRIAVIAGEATVQDQPLRRPMLLEDGAVIGCGTYRIRYENLLS
jgi:hypothetical protein